MNWIWNERKMGVEDDSPAVDVSSHQEIGT